MTPPTIYTFGFGYELDTPLLVEIARVGKGCFSFIPDSGFVGTVLVHTLANVASTVGKCATLTVTLPDVVTSQLRHHPKDYATPNQADKCAIALLGHEVQILSGNKYAISLDRYISTFIDIVP
jgi:hypothetical protein